MELTGAMLIAAPREEVWDALNDPNVLVHCIPGCEEVQQISPTETHTRVLLKMGPVRARFVGKILMSDIRAAEGCTLDFQGSGGAAGFARGTSVVTLASEGEGTRLQYSATASVGGKLGQIGGRMIDASAKQMAEQFFSALQAQLAGAPVAAAHEPEPEVAPVQPAAAAPAAPAAPRPPVTAVRPAPSATPLLTSEGVRALWFCLGALSTGFGVWLASQLMR
ncbi:MAG: carbon monoxide dehydrogenase subunit G [Noviherbaspirillum sp.]